MNPLTASATSIAEAVRDGTVSAAEVVEATLERIARDNPRVNAVVTLTADEALAAAAAVDRRRARGEEPGPLAGVPFTVKDVIATAGIRTTAGSLLLADFVPERGAPAVDRLLTGGAILVGKSNCPEFALDVHTTNRLFGTTENPVAPGRTPGGSSGGDSAAVAAGFAALGIGTDYGGSVRWPAHCTGLAALRPTLGLVPGTGTLPYAGEGALPPPNPLSLQHRVQVIGPIAREVRDLWTALRVMSGPDGLDADAVPVALGDPERVDVSSLAVAWCEGEGTMPVRADVAATVASAAEALAERGLDVEHARPPGLERAEAVYAPLRAADGLADHAALAEGREDELTETMRGLLARAETATVARYRELAAERASVRAGVLAFMRERPILLLPVAALPAFEADATSFHVDGVEVPRMNLVTNCRVVSLLGFPAAVIPCGTSDEGLPLGVQVVGRPFADHEVVAVATALEASFGRWRAPVPVRAEAPA